MSRIDPYLGTEFFRRNHLELARDLLGCTLEWDGCAGTIAARNLLLGWGACGRR